MPDLSSASERVSEIVSTAMLRGTNAFVSSMADIELYPSCPGRGAASFTLLRRAGTHSLARLRRWAPALQRTASRCAASGARAATKLLPTRPERVAGLHGSLLIAGHEPLL